MKLEPKPTKASATRKRRRSVKAEKVTPEEVCDDWSTNSCLQLFIIVFSLQLEDAASKGKTETEKTIATMFDILKVNKKVRLENLVLNRISFAQTVENLFALSFLVKDGRVLIMVHDDGSHYVCMAFT